MSIRRFRVRRILDEPGLGRGMMRVSGLLRTANAPMTLPLACVFSVASGHPSISTGKERDTESGNDDLLARYYANTYGRFITPDWSAKVMPVPYVVLGDPQSLDLYSYVRNNPLINVDLDGHDGDCPKGSWWPVAQVSRMIVPPEM